MLFHSLPVELLNATAEFLDRRDLLALSTTNSVFYAVAQRLLYRDVAVASRSPKSLSIVSTLASKPHLARHVRSFQLIVDIRHAKPSEAFYHTLSDALSHMRELLSLKLVLGPEMSSVLPTAPNIAFPRLRSLDCSFPLDQNLAQFLGKTDALVSLAVTHGSQSSTITSGFPKSYIPLLSSFAGSSQAARAIVPGRPVGSIFLYSEDLTEDVVTVLAKSAAPVSVLDAKTASLPLPLLESMALHMPELEYLSLQTTYNLWDEVFNTPFIHNIKNALMAMEHLKTAQVSGMLWRWLTKHGRVLANEPYIPSPVSEYDDTQYYHA